MHARLAALAATSLACLACWPTQGGLHAQTPRDIPQSERVENEGVVVALQGLAARKPPVGPAAQKVLALMTARIAYEEAVILPPLALLPALAEGDPTPDMRWAIAMADRVRAERETLRSNHAALNVALIALRDAGAAEDDHRTVGFSNDLLADDRQDQEINEPAVIMVGDYLRRQLPAQ